MNFEVNTEKKVITLLEPIGTKDFEVLKKLFADEWDLYMITFRPITIETIKWVPYEQPSLPWIAPNPYIGVSAPLSQYIGDAPGTFASKIPKIWFDAFNTGTLKIENLTEETLSNLIGFRI